MLLSISLLTALFASTAVFAKARSDYEKRSVTTYFFNLEDTGTTECLFFEDEPNVAYIDPVDYLSRIYTTGFSQEKNGDGTFTVTKSTGETMIADINADRLSFDSFENFVFDNVNQDGSITDAEYDIEYPAVIKGEKKGAEISLSDYGIDMVEADGRLYIPLPTLSDIFNKSYIVGVYYDDGLYYVHTMDDRDYFVRSAMFDTLTRDATLIDYTYRELCFVIDQLYGQPSKCVLAQSIAEKGFDKTLDEYNDDTRQAKQWLLSDQWIDFYAGLFLLQQYMKDGGHTALHVEPDVIRELYPETKFAREWEKVINFMVESETAQEQAIRKELLNDLTDGFTDMRIISLRQREYEKYNTAKSWENGDSCKTEGDTVVFVFDSFLNESVEHFKWSLDYAKEKGAENFLIDISCNRGGSTSVLAYMMAMITNKTNHSNIFNLSTLCTVTGNTLRSASELDLNLDGKFDERDKDVVYDFNFAILTSHLSFSCGNLLPVLAQQNGIPILGETSGGGSCSVVVAFLPQTSYYSFSSCQKLVREDGTDTDTGAAVDYDLTKKIYDEALQHEDIDYTGLYDLADVSAKILAFYAKPADETEPASEAPTEKPEPTAQPATQAPTSQATAPAAPAAPAATPDSSSKTNASSTSGGGAVQTGAAFPTVAILFSVLALTGMIGGVFAGRKKIRSDENDKEYDDVL